MALFSTTFAKSDISLMPLMAGQPLIFALSLFSHGVLSAETTKKTADEYISEAKKYLNENKQNDALQMLELAVSADPESYITRFKRAGNSFPQLLYVYAL